MASMTSYHGPHNGWSNSERCMALATMLYSMLDLASELKMSTIVVGADANVSSTLCREMFENDRVLGSLLPVPVSRWTCFELGD